MTCAIDTAENKIEIKFDNACIILLSIILLKYVSQM